MSTTAATGTRLVRATTAGGAQYSLDNGATWRVLPSDMTGTMLNGTAGRFIDVIQKSLPPADDEDDSNPVVFTAFQVFDPATGAVMTLPGHLGKGANEYPERISDAACTKKLSWYPGSISGPYTLGRLNQEPCRRVTRVDGVKLGTQPAPCSAALPRPRPRPASRCATSPNRARHPSRPTSPSRWAPAGRSPACGATRSPSVADRRHPQTLVLNCRTKETRVCSTVTTLDHGRRLRPHPRARPVCRGGGCRTGPDWSYAALWEKTPTPSP